MTLLVERLDEAARRGVRGQPARLVGQLRLRELRRERGLSFRRLADRVYYSKSLVHKLETGEAVPTVDIATRLDVALEAGGELAAMVVDSAPLVLTEDDEARLLHVARNPRKVDRSAVDSLAA